MLIELPSLGVTAEALRANIDWKSAFLKGWSVSAKFLRSRGRPLPTIFARIDRPVNNFVAESTRSGLPLSVNLTFFR